MSADTSLPLPPPLLPPSPTTTARHRRGSQEDSGVFDDDGGWVDDDDGRHSAGPPTPAEDLDDPRIPPDLDPWERALFAELVELERQLPDVWITTDPPDQAEALTPTPLPQCRLLRRPVDYAVLWHDRLGRLPLYVVLPDLGPTVRVRSPADAEALHRALAYCWPAWSRERRRADVDELPLLRWSCLYGDFAGVDLANIQLLHPTEPPTCRTLYYWRRARTREVPPVSTAGEVGRLEVLLEPLRQLLEWRHHPTPPMTPPSKDSSPKLLLGDGRRRAAVWLKACV